jgi:hypothetical protein
MLKQLKYTALAAVLVCVPVAAAEDYYIGLQGGYFIAGQDGGDLQQRFDDGLITATVNSFDEERFSWRLFAGFSLGEKLLDVPLSLELGYTDLGTVTADISGADTETIADEFSPSAQGIDLSVVARYQVHERVTLVGRAGLWYWWDDIEVGNDSYDVNGIDPLIGVGIETPLSKDLTLRVGYDAYRTDHGWHGFLTAGVVMPFSI